MRIIPFLLVSLSLSTTFAKDTPLVTGDIGGSSGNNNGTTYQEVHLGVNLNFTDWLTWRNTGFQRTGSKTKTFTGLDSTMRLVLRTKFDQNGGANIFIGPGYRWTSDEVNNAVIGEAGVGVNFSGVGLSAGAKYLKYDKARVDTAGNALKNEDVNYFVNITGNTSFGK
ncbi:hypothetical protein CIK05_12510 [Bdellovibrio sp. qaytius]|nr:hypothetical protein CIK05_12510 [Bdellovibrio sp. qaytius]